MNMPIEEIKKQPRGGKRLAGLIIVLVGAALLGKQLGLLIPAWVFTWPVLLIVIGLFIGAKHSFRHPGWIIMCMIGGVFLAERLVEGVSISQFLWPAVIIIVGLIMIFRPGKRKWGNEHWREAIDRSNAYEINNEEYINSVGIFGGTKKNILSKDFKGGEIVCVFGGAEINLSQAEIKGHVVLEIVNVFGGTKLIVPPNWEIKSEMVAILGGIEDRRVQMANTTNGIDVLVIKGTCIFGGIEIKSF